MFSAIFQGIVLGLSVAVPFGPLNLLILSYALKSFKNAFFLGLGAMSADICYLVLLLFGLLRFLDNELFTKILAIFGFCFLSYLAFLSLKAKNTKLNIKEEKVNESVLKSYIKGFVLNLVNPYIVTFWLSISSLFIHIQAAFFVIIAMFFTILAWVFCLSFFVSKFTSLFSAKVISYINLGSALIIEYFAIYLIYKTFFV